MPFLDSLDIANRVCQIVGVDQIFSVTEDSNRAVKIAAAYDKLRRAEMQRNVWRFAVRKAALRAIDSDTLLVSPSAWSASKTYALGEFATDTNGQIWQSATAGNINNSPGGNNTAWEMYYGPLTVDEWDSTISYYSGELVYVITAGAPSGYQVYMSLLNGNSDTPGTVTAWSALTQYNQDQIVSYSGSQWRSLLPVNLNNTPASGPLAWASGTTYSASQQVTGSDNYIYTATGSTTGNDPTTDGGVHWTNTNTLNAWTQVTGYVSSVNWRPVTCALRNVTLNWPIGSGPRSQASTRNVFRLPAGYLRRAPQFEKVPTSALGGPNGIPLDDWEMDGSYIVTQETGPVILRFVADIMKVSLMDDMFCEGLAYRIATAVAPELAQSEAKLQSIASAYKQFQGEARLVNGIEEGYEDPPDDEYVTVRY